jgi:hypothetical protein
MEKIVNRWIKDLEHVEGELSSGVSAVVFNISEQKGDTISYSDYKEAYNLYSRIPKEALKVVERKEEFVYVENDGDLELRVDANTFAQSAWSTMNIYEEEDREWAIVNVGERGKATPGLIYECLVSLGKFPCKTSFFAVLKRSTHRFIHFSGAEVRFIHERISERGEELIEPDDQTVDYTIQVRYPWPLQKSIHCTEWLNNISSVFFK